MESSKTKLAAMALKHLIEKLQMLASEEKQTAKITWLQLHYEL